MHTIGLRHAGERRLEPFPYVHVSDLFDATRFPPEIAAASARIEWRTLAAKGSLQRQAFVGTGLAFGSDDALARTVAVSEAVERFACSTVSGRKLVQTTQRALGEDALDVTTLPRCSERELERPQCSIAPAGPDTEMLWTPSFELTERRWRWIPAATAYLYNAPGREQRHWLGISTGCAAHTDPVEAVINGILEVCERDSSALVWERRLGLPRLAIDRMPDRVRSVVEFKRRNFTNVSLFDATTDVGVPAVFYVERASLSEVSQVAGCATGFDLASAAARVVKESVAQRIAMQRFRDGADERDVLDFRELESGSALMSRRELASSFDFLDQPGDRISGPPLEASTDDPSRSRLDALVSALARVGAHVYVVDLGTPHSRACGRQVVRVVIPELQPFSHNPFVRYRAHPRLYTRFGTMTPVVPEEHLNPDPCPLA